MYIAYKTNNKTLSVAEKNAFLYFYTSAFCSLTDRPTDKIKNIRGRCSCNTKNKPFASCFACGMLKYFE